MNPFLKLAALAALLLGVSACEPSAGHPSWTIEQSMGDHTAVYRSDTYPEITYGQVRFTDRHSGQYKVLMGTVAITQDR